MDDSDLFTLKEQMRFCQMQRPFTNFGTLTIIYIAFRRISIFVPEKLTSLPKKELKTSAKFLCHVYTLPAVLIGWVMFRADTLADAWIYLKRMFGVSRESQVLVHWMMYPTYEEIAVFAVAALCSFPLFRNLIASPAAGESEAEFVGRQKIRSG